MRQSVQVVRAAFLLCVAPGSCLGSHMGPPPAEVRLQDCTPRKAHGVWDNITCSIVVDVHQPVLLLIPNSPVGWPGLDRLSRLVPMQSGSVAAETCSSGRDCVRTTLAGTPVTVWTLEPGRHDLEVGIFGAGVLPDGLSVFVLEPGTGVIDDNSLREAFSRPHSRHDFSVDLPTAKDNGSP